MQIGTVKNGTTVRIVEPGHIHYGEEHTIDHKSPSLSKVYTTENETINWWITVEIVDVNADAKDVGVSVDMTDVIITSRDEAEFMAKDRLQPYLWRLRERIEARINVEWVPGTKIEIELQDMEELIATQLGAEYELQGWTVTVGGKRRDSTTKWIILE